MVITAVIATIITNAQRIIRRHIVTTAPVLTHLEAIIARVMPVGLEDNALKISTNVYIGIHVTMEAIVMILLGHSVVSVEEDILANIVTSTPVIQIPVRTRPDVK